MTEETGRSAPSAPSAEGSAEAGGKGNLRWHQIAAYSSLGIPLAAVGLPLGVFVTPYYADELGLGLTLTGTIFMLLRFWDLITDPLVGYLVDSRPSRLGRVRHWMLLGLPVLMVAAYFVYLPSPGEKTGWYLGAWMLVFYTGHTLINTPSDAWVPAIAPSYDQRSRLFVFREMVTTVTFLLLLALPVILQGDGSLRGPVAVMGMILIASLPVTILGSAVLVPDPRRMPAREAGAPSQWSPASLRAALSNRILWRILAAYLAAGIGVSATASTYVFVARYSFGLPDQLAFTVLFVFFVSGLAAMPFWLALARRTEKHIALRSLACFSSLAFLSYLPLWAFVGGFWPMLAGAILSGVSFGAPFAIIRAMVADLIDAEQARAGIDRSGLYYSALTACYKMGASLAVGVTYIMLGLLVGFEANDPSTHTEGRILGLILVFSLTPAICYAVMAALVWRYPLTRARQAEAAAQLGLGAGAAAPVAAPSGLTPDP